MFSLTNETKMGVGLKNLPWDKKYDHLAHGRHVPHVHNSEEIGPKVPPPLVNHDFHTLLVRFYFILDIGWHWYSLKSLQLTYSTHRVLVRLVRQKLLFTVVFTPLEQKRSYWSFLITSMVCQGLNIADGVSVSTTQIKEG